MRRATVSPTTPSIQRADDHNQSNQGWSSRSRASRRGGTVPTRVDDSAPLLGSLGIDVVSVTVNRWREAGAAGGRAGGRSCSLARATDERTNDHVSAVVGAATGLTRLARAAGRVAARRARD